MVPPKNWFLLEQIIKKAKNKGVTPTSDNHSQVEQGDVVSPAEPVVSIGNQEIFGEVEIPESANNSQVVQSNNDPVSNVEAVVEP